MAPVVRKRLCAKVLDFVSMGGLAALTIWLVDVPLVGFAVSAALLLAGDRLGISWKSSFGLEVVDAVSGEPITLPQSVQRNVMWIVSSGARAVVMSLQFEPSMVTRAQSLIASIGIGIGFTLTYQLLRTGRHLGDQAAGTVVRQKAASLAEGMAISPPRHHTFHVQE